MFPWREGGEEKNTPSKCATCRHFPENLRGRKLGGMVNFDSARTTNHHGADDGQQSSPARYPTGVCCELRGPLIRHPLREVCIGEKATQGETNDRRMLRFLQKNVPLYREPEARRLHYQKKTNHSESCPRCVPLGAESELVQRRAYKATRVE